MEKTVTYNSYIEEWLSKQAIEYTVVNGIIGVNRDSMCNHTETKSLYEDEGYDYILEKLREDFPYLRISWGGKSDDEIFLDILKK